MFSTEPMMGLALRATLKGSKKLSLGWKKSWVKHLPAQMQWLTMCAFFFCCKAKVHVNDLFCVYCNELRVYDFSELQEAAGSMACSWEGVIFRSLLTGLQVFVYMCRYCLSSYVMINKYQRIRQIKSKKGIFLSSPVSLKSYTFKYLIPKFIQFLLKEVMIYYLLLNMLDFPTLFSWEIIKC